MCDLTHSDHIPDRLIDCVEVFDIVDRMLFSVIGIWALLSAREAAGAMLYPFGEDVMDEAYTYIDESNITKTLAVEIPIMAKVYDSITVYDNGIINFGEHQSLSWDNSETLPRVGASPALFLFWVDWDFTVGSNQSIYIGEHYMGNLTLNREMYPRIKNEVIDAVANNSQTTVDPTFDPLYLLTVTYYKGTYWGGGPTTPVNTIQVNIVSDLVRTYVIYIYDNVEWIQMGQYARIAYDECRGRSGGFYEHPYSGSPDLFSIAEYSNMGDIEGQLMFQMDVACDNSLCVDGVCLEGGYCLCTNGYEGMLCDAEIDECLSNPCVMGRCRDLLDEFACDCQPGHTGTLCEIDITYCWPGLCIYGTCIELDTSYSCDCTPGYTGVHCDTEINECWSCPCSHGDCIDDFLQYNCSCDLGYAGHDCDIDVDDCRDHDCDHGQCVDGVSHYICFCDPGYTGQRCVEELDACDHSPCQMGTCVDRDGYFECECPPGYKGPTCGEDTDECEPAPCLHGVCSDGVDSYTCSCDEGYTGVRCEVGIDDCKPTSCGDHGSCLDVTPGFICQCRRGFTGSLCQINIDECSSLPCIHGSCHDGVDNYRCDCYAGYNGINCEHDVDECEESTCRHGDCEDAIASYTCQCDDGFTGAMCETNIDDCLAGPCQHGLCHDKVGEFECECIPGYEGEICQSNVDDCQSSPCALGDCVDTVNGYICVCPDGVSGEHCKVDEGPAVGSFGDWGPWTTCSKLCDNGLQTRYRPCLREPCLDNNDQVQLCNTVRCQGDSYYPQQKAVSLETSKSAREVARDEPKLKTVFAEVVNNYCGEKRTECCRLINVTVPTVVSEFSAFHAENVSVASGYPLVITSKKMRIMLTIRTDIDQLWAACVGQVRTSTTATSRDVYLSRSILQTAVHSAMDRINEVTCCWKLFAPGRDPTTSYILMGVLIPLGIGLIIFVVVMINSSCNTRSRLATRSRSITPDAQEGVTGQTDLVYRSTGYVHYSPEQRFVAS